MSAFATKAVLLSRVRWRFSLRWMLMLVFVVALGLIYPASYMCETLNEVRLVRELEQREQLSLRKTSLLPHLAALNDLVSLDLRQNPRLTSEAVGVLRQSLPKGSIQTGEP